MNYQSAICFIERFALYHEAQVVNYYDNRTGKLITDCNMIQACYYKPVKYVLPVTNVVSAIMLDEVTVMCSIVCRGETVQVQISYDPVYESFRVINFNPVAIIRYIILNNVIVKKRTEKIIYSNPVLYSEYGVPNQASQPAPLDQMQHTNLVQPDCNKPPAHPNYLNKPTIPSEPNALKPTAPNPPMPPKPTNLTKPIKKIIKRSVAFGTPGTPEHEIIEYDEEVIVGYEAEYKNADEHAKVPVDPAKITVVDPAKVPIDPAKVPVDPAKITVVDPAKAPVDPAKVPVEQSDCKVSLAAEAVKRAIKEAAEEAARETLDKNTVPYSWESHIKEIDPDEILEKIPEDDFVILNNTTNVNSTNTNVDSKNTSVDLKHTSVDSKNTNADSKHTSVDDDNFDYDPKDVKLSELDEQLMNELTMKKRRKPVRLLQMSDTEDIYNYGSPKNNNVFDPQQFKSADPANQPNQANPANQLNQANPANQTNQADPANQANPANYTMITNARLKQILDQIIESKISIDARDDNILFDLTDPKPISEIIKVERIFVMQHDREQARLAEIKKKQEQEQQTKARIEWEKQEHERREREQHEQTQRERGLEQWRAKHNAINQKNTTNGQANDTNSQANDTNGQANKFYTVDEYNLSILMCFITDKFIEDNLIAVDDVNIQSKISKLIVISQSLTDYKLMETLKKIAKYILQAVASGKIRYIIVERQDVINLITAVYKEVIEMNGDYIGNEAHIESTEGLVA